MKRWFWPWALLAGSHFLATAAVGGLIFLASHLPTKAVDLDPVVSALAAVEWVLVAPRKGILAGWPSETTPALLPAAATLLNSLAWGALLLAVQRGWRRLTR